MGINQELLEIPGLPGLQVKGRADDGRERTQVRRMSSRLSDSG